jgi:hypothetical protein
MTLFLIVVISLLIVYVIYLMVAKRALWEDYNVEKVRREWDRAWFYYQTHSAEIELLDKKRFWEDFPLLRGVFENSTVEEIKKSIKECYNALLPYMDNVDKFIDEVLYKNRPHFLSRLWRKFIINPNEQKMLRNKKHE